MPMQKVGCMKFTSNFNEPSKVSFASVLVCKKERLLPSASTAMMVFVRILQVKVKPSNNVIQTKFQIQIFPPFQSKHPRNEPSKVSFASVLVCKKERLLPSAFTTMMVFVRILQVNNFQKVPLVLV